MEKFLVNHQHYRKQQKGRKGMIVHISAKITAKQAHKCACATTRRARNTRKIKDRASDIQRI